MNPFLMAGGLSLFILAEFTLTVGYPLLVLADEWLSARLYERRAIRAARRPVPEFLRAREHLRIRNIIGELPAYVRLADANNAKRRARA